MPEYSPFEKNLDALETADLAALRNAVEGWYIEYKREAVDAKSIAKSVSAFANTYGGWLFYGVCEKAREDSVAGSFPGLSKSDVDVVLQRLRNATAMYLNPSPHFDLKVLWGPCEAINLGEDRGIICVRVPKSVLSPHVHKSGVVYRRVSDASEPRPESDRFALDQLWRRADGLREQYKEWVNRDPELSKAEEKLPYLRIMLVADLWHDRGARLNASIADVREIFGQIRSGGVSLPFDTVYTSADGFVARQLANNDPYNLGLTWELGLDLVSDILLPLPFYAPTDINLLVHQLRGYTHIDRFVDILRKSKNSSPRVIDLNYIFNVLLGLVDIQRRILSRAAWPHGYTAKVRLLNCWRTVPFLDVPIVLDDFENHGIPMCLRSEVTAPSGHEIDSFQKIFEKEIEGESEEDRVNVIVPTALIFSHIAYAFGVPPWIEQREEADTASYYGDLSAAGNRAIDRQKRRIESERN